MMIVSSGRIISTVVFIVGYWGNGLIVRATVFAAWQESSESSRLRVVKIRGSQYHPPQSRALQICVRFALYVRGDHNGLSHPFS